MWIIILKLIQNDSTSYRYKTQIVKIAAEMKGHLRSGHDVSN